MNGRLECRARFGTGIVLITGRLATGSYGCRRNGRAPSREASRRNIRRVHLEGPLLSRPCGRPYPAYGRHGGRRRSPADTDGADVRRCRPDRPRALRTETREPGKGIGRDPERTPFPWQSGPGAGFTTGQPWLRLGTDTPLSEQRDDPASMVSLYRALLALRRQHPALAEGRIDQVTAQGPVLSFRRIAEGERLAVLANTGSTPATAAAFPGEIVLSTRGDRLNERVAQTLALRADEAVILGLDTAD